MLGGGVFVVKVKCVRIVESATDAGSLEREDESANLGLLAAVPGIVRCPVPLVRRFVEGSMTRLAVLLQAVRLTPIPIELVILLRQLAVYTARVNDTCVTPLGAETVSIA